VSTWRAELSRDDAGTLTTVAPEKAPEWVNDLVADLAYRFRESPDARSVTVSVDGEDTPPEESPDATAGTTSGPVASSGPGAPPPDATPAATPLDGLT
jgi:hypothetical protein